jgi:hypothetical protein
MYKRFVLAAIAACLSLFAQISDLNEQQTAALKRMSADLAPQLESLANARAALVKAAYADPRDNALIDVKVEAVATDELALARARAEAFSSLQSSPAKLAPKQIADLVARGGILRNGASPFAPGGTIPNITQAQVDALTRMTTDLMPLARRLATARSAVTSAALTDPRDEAAMRSKVQAVQEAELTLANARADAFAKIESSANKLAPDQIKAFVDLGGSFANIAFTKPEPLNFSDHEGYVSLFDGVSLKGWDGNPKFWRVEDGAIVGESTVQNPSGNTYLVYRDIVAKDFTLKFEIKVEGSGGSGFQYRSKTGMPWLANIASNVTANVGPVNLNWMLTGPQADFWPAAQYWTGQFYSENTPMRIQAWRGEVVEGSGLAKKQLMGNIGDIDGLGKLVKMNDWNEYTVIARGGTMIQILNGQLMAVMVDDDPNSSNNQPGFFGIEIEATTKVSVRNIWVKRFD